MAPTYDGERVVVVRGDITTLAVDAIVNAANESLTPGGGVCGAIHRAAGPALAAACREVAPCATGDAVATPGGSLPQRTVIHAVGPIWRDGKHGEPEALASCYRRSLEVAGDLGARSIAFPAISTGIFGYPLEDACRIAARAIKTYVDTDATPERIVLCAFDPQTERVLRMAWGAERGA